MNLRGYITLGESTLKFVRNGSVVGCSTLVCSESECLPSGVVDPTGVAIRF